MREETRAMVQLLEVVSCQKILEKVVTESEENSNAGNDRERVGNGDPYQQRLVKVDVGFIHIGRG